MKNRRTTIIALLVAALSLSIGYAALSDTLDINGTADVNQSAAEEAFNEDIYFSAAVANQEGDLASVVDGDPDMATFTVASLNGQGDTASFTFTIVNEGDVDAKITPTLATDGNTNAEYFDIESDWAGATKDLAAGGSLTYTVTVTLKKTPTDTIHGAFHIEMTAESVEG